MNIEKFFTKPKTRKSNRRRIYALDELRGFSVFCMVFYHAFFSIGEIFKVPFFLSLLKFFMPAEPFFAGNFYNNIRNIFKSQPLKSISWCKAFYSGNGSNTCNISRRARIYNPVWRPAYAFCFYANIWIAAKATLKNATNIRNDFIRSSVCNKLLCAIQIPWHTKYFCNKASECALFNILAISDRLSKCKLFFIRLFSVDTMAFRISFRNIYR